MSVMRCSHCGKFVDTDFDEFNFEETWCLECESKRPKAGPSQMLPHTKQDKSRIENRLLRGKL